MSLDRDAAATCLVSLWPARACAIRIAMQALSEAQFGMGSWWIGCARHMVGGPRPHKCYRRIESMVKPTAETPVPDTVEATRHLVGEATTITREMMERN